MKKSLIALVALVGLNHASAFGQACTSSFDTQTGQFNMTCQCPTGTFQTGFSVDENEYDMEDDGVMTLHCESPANWL